MRINRFIGNFNLKAGELKIDDPEFFNQTRSVLKLKVGESVVIGDGKMNESVAEILKYGRDFITVNIGEVKINQNESRVNVTLYCSILKKENFEFVVQKATEVGVTEIVPLITTRTIKLDVRKDRLEKIIREAAEQSGRGIVPLLAEPMEFGKSIGTAKDQIKLLFDGSGESFKSPERPEGSNSLGIWIGPEGGWTPEELQSASNLGFKIINLGKTTLRAETAAIIATYLVVHNL